MAFNPDHHGARCDRLRTRLAYGLTDLSSISPLAPIGDRHGRRTSVNRKLGSAGVEWTTMVNYISGLVFVILLLVGGAVVAPLATVNPVLAVVVGIVWLIADADHLLGDPARRAVGEGGRLPAGQVQGHQGARPVPDHPPDRPGPHGRHPRPGRQHPEAAGDHPRQRAGDDRRRPLLPGGRTPPTRSSWCRTTAIIISQYAQTSLRDVIGQMTLDQLLTEREQIAKAIEPTSRMTPRAGGWKSRACGSRTSTCPRSSRR